MADYPTVRRSLPGAANLFGKRFAEHWRRLAPGEGAPVLVACSGGLDSVVLLYLLRFHAHPPPATVTAAHLDHGMRAASAADADWVAGLCAAWNIPLWRERLASPPRSEADARAQRYERLEHARRAVDADWIATAHHADDQAETVLFRVVRGTGLDGLRGIPERDPHRHLLRPLLPFWRTEIVAFARSAGLRWREDTSNRRLAHTRNRLRHQILPALERYVAPGARRSLVRLAAAASEAADRTDAVVLPLVANVPEPDGTFLLARSTFAGYDAGVAAGVLRQILRRFDVVLDRVGTRSAIEFISQAASGREMQLPRGVRIVVEFDTARIGRAATPPPDRPLVVPDAPHEPFTGSVCLAGRRFTVHLQRSAANAERRADGAVLLHGRLRFPLRLRAWQPGDRIRSGGYTRRLKTLFAQQRVGRSARAAVPVLVDAAGHVLWVAGIACADAVAPQAGGPAFLLQVTDDGNC